MLLNAAKFQVYNFYRFCVTKEKLARNAGGGGYPLPPPMQIKVNLKNVVNATSMESCFGMSTCYIHMMLLSIKP